MPAVERPVIYQALPRLFGNCNGTRRRHGSMEENGCGKFADFSEAALRELAGMGFTHLWLTGIHEQMSGTAYPGRPADPPELLKGKAGSPYAIRDYFDVCPDYAVDPGRRLEEFRELLARCEAAGLKALIDFVPNHVARTYASDVRPELDFGRADDRSVFFRRDNHFFYVQPGQAAGGPGLVLPTSGEIFGPEKEHARVTGNNAVTFAPGMWDWYETVKLNYGHDFTRGRDTSHLPGPDAPPEEVPDTWRKMDAILAWWQGFGVAGFRADMAHLVPAEFWRWAVRRARGRNEEVYFFGEAYDNDPARLTEGNVIDALLEAGFDAVYDDPAYDLCMGLYDDFAGGFKWANDLDALEHTGPRFHRSLRYGENHDEVRLASPQEWAGLGMKVGRPVCAALFGMGRGPLMVYHGQEVGEPAIGAEGFSGDDGRTSIFDYWSMPEFAKWVNGERFDGGGLSAEQKDLRDWYGRLLRVLGEPAFTRGEFYALNPANHGNPAFGRLEGESVSGHWLYTYLRRDASSGQVFLVAVNFHGEAAMERVRMVIPRHAMSWLGWEGRERISGAERLEGTWAFEADLAAMADGGLELPPLPPCSAVMVEFDG